MKDNFKIEECDDLHINIKSMEKGTLLNDDCSTILNVSLNTNGDIITSFFGSYNEHILNYMLKIYKTHIKLLKKKLIKNKNVDIEEHLNKVKEKCFKIKNENKNSDNLKNVDRDEQNIDILANLKDVKDVKDALIKEADAFNEKNKNVNKKLNNKTLKTNKNNINKNLKSNSYDIKKVNNINKNKNKK